MISPQERAVYDVLAQLEIPYTRREHPPVYTVEDASRYDIHLPGVHCKNLFLRNKKGDQHYLAVLAVATQVSLRELAQRIGSSNLSFASPERLARYLGVETGAVGPFGLINDAEKVVQVLLDRTLEGPEPVGFHPNVNTSTLMVPFNGLQKFLAWCGNKIIWI
jgi:Ala-tRNA(Pro) deacylase